MRVNIEQSLLRNLKRYVPKEMYVIRLKLLTSFGLNTNICFTDCTWADSGVWLPLVRIWGYTAICWCICDTTGIQRCTIFCLSLLWVQGNCVQSCWSYIRIVVDSDCENNNAFAAARIDLFEQMWVFKRFSIDFTCSSGDCESCCHLLVYLYWRCCSSRDCWCCAFAAIYWCKCLTACYCTGSIWQCIVVQQERFVHRYLHKLTYTESLWCDGWVTLCLDHHQDS